jgi:hypothetical protein
VDVFGFDAGVAYGDQYLFPLFWTSQSGWFLGSILVPDLFMHLNVCFIGQFGLWLFGLV